MRILCAAILAGLGFFPVAAAADPAGTPGQLPPGLAAMHTWLAEFDKGDFAQCWKDGAKLLRDSITLQQAVESDAKQAQAFGPCLKRTFVTARNHNRFRRRDGTEIEGEFIEALFETDFKFQPHVTEILSAMKEPDGAWRVFAYDARPQGTP